MTARNHLHDARAAATDSLRDPFWVGLRLGHPSTPQVGHRGLGRGLHLRGLRRRPREQRLSVDFSLPGQPGYVTAQEDPCHLPQRWQQHALDPRGVGTARPAAWRARRARSAAAFGELRKEMPQLRVVDYGVTGNKAFRYRRRSGDLRPCLRASAHEFRHGHDRNPGPSPGESRHCPRTRLGSRACPSWRPELLQRPRSAHRDHDRGGGRLGRAGFRLRSFLALVPLVVAAVSILTSLLVVLGLTYITEVSFIVEFLVALVGPGGSHRLLAAVGHQVAGGKGPRSVQPGRSGAGRSRRRAGRSSSQGSP